MDLLARFVSIIGAAALLLPLAGGAKEHRRCAALARIQPPEDLADRLTRAAKEGRAATKGALPAPVRDNTLGCDDHAVFSAEVMATYFPDRDMLLERASKAEETLLSASDATLKDPEERRRAEQDRRAYLEARNAALERMRGDAFGPAAVVVSGGTSLGAYEAGLLYYYTFIQAQWAAQEARRAVKPGADWPRQFQVATGTSAGAINAFLSALAACRVPEPDPDKSLFSIWTQVDWNDLLDGKDENQCGYLDGALKRTKIRKVMEMVVAAFDRPNGWVKCDVSFGLAVANIVPRQVPLNRGGVWGHSNLQVSRLTERFVVRLLSDGNGPPRLTGRRGTDLKLGDEFLPVLGDRSAASLESPVKLTPGQVGQVLLASSGIPGIFNPIRLEFTVDEGLGPKYHSGCFMDGGVLDNVPLSTAIRLSGSVEEQQKPLLLDKDQPPGAARPPAIPVPSAFYLYVDPDNVDRPPAPLKEPDGKLVPALAMLFGNMVKGARQAELVRTIEEQPWVRPMLRLPARKHVITGELLSAFGAFLDLSFRRFDFLAGMADAQRALRGSIFYAEVRKNGLDNVAMPAFACFEKVWVSPEAMDSAPECRALRDSTCTSPADCGASERDLWRLLHASVLLDQQRDDPDLTRRFFDLLSRSEGARIGGTEARGYEYLTLKLGGDVAEPDEGLQAARFQLQRMVNGVARGSQSVLIRPVINTIGANLLDDALGYRKVRTTWSTGLVGHGLELAFARQLWRLPVDWVAEAQLADRRFAPWVNVGRMADARLRTGLRGEVAISPLIQLQAGATVGGQGIWAHAYRPVYRWNWSLRGDAQLLQRLYLSLVWARGLGPPSIEPRSDLNVGLGIRWWLE